jgi:hypothetical protein
MLAKMDSFQEKIEANQEKMDAFQEVMRTNSEKFEVLRGTLISRMDIHQARTESTQE